MDGKTKFYITLVLVNICFLALAGLVTYKLLHGTVDSPITRAPDSALNIVHFNDGYDIRKTPRFMTRYLERMDKETLSVFSGDILNPSLISNYIKGDQFIKFMHIAKVQFAVPGNHEYDFGEERFEHFKKLLQTNWLIANLKLKSDPNKSVSDLSEHAITELNGIKIGIFGLIDDNWMNSCKGLDFSKFEYESFDKAAVRVSAYLKNEGCTMIFLVSHMSNISDEKVLTDDNSVDLILGGHDHIFYIRRLNNKVLVKSGSDFEYFSQLKVFFSKESPSTEYCNESCLDYKYLLDEEKNANQVFFNFTLPRKDGLLLNVAIEKVEIQNDDVKHSEMWNYIETEIDPLVRDYLVPIFKLGTKLDAREMQLGNRQIAIGNFFADLAASYYGTEIGIVNGGIFKSEKIFPKDSFFKRIDLLKIFPYQRDLFVIVDLTGQEIIDAIEEGLQVYPKYSAKFLSISGVKFTFRKSAEPFKRVVLESVIVLNAPINLEKTYSVVLNSGLKHKQFGNKVLIPKVVKNEEKDQISPVELIEKFSKLTDSQQNVDEFNVFKSQFSDFNFEKLSLFSNLSEKKGLGNLMLIDMMNEDKTAELNKLSSESMKRLRMFSLAKEIVQVDNRNIFKIEPKLDKRLVVDKNETSKTHIEI